MDHSKKQSTFSLCVIGSGSKGNSIYISNESGGSVLIDAGFSGKETEKRLNTIGVSPCDLDAIIVSHEHSDHIKGVGILSRRYDLPIFMTPKTFDASSAQIGNIKHLNHFECGNNFKIKSIKIHPFSTSHDAVDSSGFIFQCNGTKIGIATDLGTVPNMVKEHLKGCNALIIEANHDPELLINGPYPWPLKQRIKSRKGHLSNQESKDLINDIKHEKLSHVILAHLSEQNNTPQKALHIVGQALNNCKTKLSFATQNNCSNLIKIK